MRSLRHYSTSTITGTGRIHFEVIEDSDALYLHMLGLIRSPNTRYGSTFTRDLISLKALEAAIIAAVPQGRSFYSTILKDIFRGDKNNSAFAVAMLRGVGIAQASGTPRAFRTKLVKTVEEYTREMLTQPQRRSPLDRHPFTTV